MDLETDVLLDATTVLAENFVIVADEVSASSALVAENADYFPLMNTVRLRISPVYSVMDKKFQIASSNLKDVEGNFADFISVAYGGKESFPELYDVSVQSVCYMHNDVIRYTCPEEGDYKVIVNIVNASLDDKDVTLIYYLQDDLENSTILSTKKLSLSKGECVSDSFDASGLNGKKVQVYLEK